MASFFILSSTLFKTDRYKSGASAYITHDRNVEGKDFSNFDHGMVVGGRWFCLSISATSDLMYFTHRVFLVPLEKSNK